MTRIITNSMIGDFENYLRSDEKYRAEHHALFDSFFFGIYIIYKKLFLLAFYFSLFHITYTFEKTRKTYAKLLTLCRSKNKIFYYLMNELYHKMSLLAIAFLILHQKLYVLGGQTANFKVIWGQKVVSNNNHLLF